MAVQDIYNAFVAAAAARALTGDPPDGLTALLDTLGVSQLGLQSGQAQLGTDSATLTGTTMFCNTPWLLTLVGKPAPTSTDPNFAALDLRLDAQQPPPGQPWTFAHAFPGVLPKSRVLDPQTPGTVGLGDSLIGPLIVAQPALLATNHDADGKPPVPPAKPPLPRLQGNLQLTNTALSSYSWFFKAQQLWLDGTIDFTQAPPLLVLRAAAPLAQLAVAGFTPTSVGILLRTDWPDPYPLPMQDALLSAIMLYATIAAPTAPPRTLELATPLFNGDYTWTVLGAIAPPLNLSGAVSLLTNMVAGTTSSSFALPSGIAALDNFGISDFAFGIAPPSASPPTLPALQYSMVRITSLTGWDPPVPFIKIDQVGVSWMFNWANPGGMLTTASVFGTFAFGAKKATRTALVGDPVRLTMELELPQLAFSAYTVDPITLSIADAFAAYFDVFPSNTPRLTISDLSIEASLPQQTYAAALTISDIWPPVTIGNVTFALGDLELGIRLAQGQLSGSLEGFCNITVPQETDVVLLASAAYPGSGAWEFDFRLFQGPLNLLKFVTAFLGQSYPQWMADDKFRIDLLELYGHYATAGTNPPYRVGAKLELALQDTVLGIPLSLTAAAAIARDSKGVLSGSVSGTFVVDRFAVTAGLSFLGSEKTYLFAVAYRDVKLIATTAWTGKDAARHQVLSFRLEGVTLGSIAEFFVNLANPNATFRLPAPWDFLNSIDLSRLTLVVDPTLQTIRLTYAVSLDLVFLSLTSVGILVDRASGESTVKLVVEGNFLGQDRTGDNALVWDAVSDSPPEIPGKGEELFDLRYLGLGQHVSPAAITSYDSISDVLDALAAVLVPLKDDATSVPIDPAKLTFDESSQWLIGFDATFMDTVTVKLILHDPDLYGILLALSGPEAGALAGFSFELLYKKVTADIGVFHARLQVPDLFRQLQFGAVSVTLGVITVDVYTNGNFRVDLGFPNGRDFTDSFAVEAGIFNGRGGLYFGVLDGATSTRVPRITNGQFSPVIELGVGLMVGVGRSFEKGPLSAGLYVDLLAIFEGTLAWFHPTDAGQPRAMYYWCRGTAGIVGKLYGSVDFKIISVDISIEAYATATLTLESYQATLVELDVGVEVHASIKILFVRISFSFGLTLQASFTIGSASTPPWTLAAGQSGRAQAQLALHAFAPRRRRPADVARMTRTAAPDGYRLVFDKTAKVFPNGETRTATLKMVPAFTIANVPVGWTQPLPPPPVPPDYRVMFALAADTAVPPGATSIAGTFDLSVAANAHAQDPADTTFAQLAEGMLRWSLDALGVTSPTATVTLGDLQELVTQLAYPEADTLGFTWDNLDGFLGGNLHLVLSAPAGGTEISGVPFPMIPALQWSTADLPTPWSTMNFWTYQPVDATYAAEAQRYFWKLDPRPTGDQPDYRAKLAAAANDDTVESMARFVFRDYFLLVARTIVQQAVDLLTAFPHVVVVTDSLAGIAGAFPTTTVLYTKVADDSVDHAAHALGMSAAELLALNPGFAAALAAAAIDAPLTVTIGVTPESIAAANPGWSVAVGATLHLGTLSVPIATGDSLATIAQGYRADPAAVYNGALDDEILAAGAAFARQPFTYANPNALPLAVVAAVYYVRNPVQPAGETVPNVDWYAEAIAAANSGLIDPDGALPNPCQVPTAFDVKTTQPWIPLPGDTLDRVATVLALAQNAVPATAFPAWLAAVTAANQPPPPAPGVNIPASMIAIAARDTFATLATRLVTTTADAAFQALVTPAPILAPLASIDVPGAVQQAGSDLTLVTLAQQYGLALEDLAARIATDTGVLVPTAAPTNELLVVPGVPALDLDSLVAALHTGQPAATVAGQVARFMLHGLRLGAPVQSGGFYHPAGPMTGIYELIGQLAPGPTPPPPPPPPIVPTNPRITLAVSQAQPVTWLSFASSTTTQAGDTVAALEARHPALHALNPALRARAAGATGLAPGMVVLTAPADILTVTVTDGQIVYPDSVLAPALQGGLAPLTLWRDVDVRHPVTQHIRWQTTVAPLIPGTLTLPPSLWLLPGDLMATAAGGVSANAYALEQVTPQAGPAAVPAVLGGYAWTTAVDLAVQQVPGSAGTLELRGADTADRQRLALLLQYLDVLPDGTAAVAAFPPPPAGEAVTWKLAWQLPSSAGAGGGLTTTALAQAASFIVKVNLSTETHSGAPRALTLAATAPTSGPYFASASDADANRFLTLVWECSVVGGGGYWLHCVAPDGTPAIPDGVFDQDGRATLTLIAQLASQSVVQIDPPWPVRNLFAFNNAALVGDGIDPGSVALFAASPAETTREATVEPGNVGFTLDLTSPENSTTITPAQQALQQLYSLLGYQLADTTAFGASIEGQPVGPDIQNGDESTWHVARVVPIYRFAKAHALPAIAGFPLPGDDPYAGIDGNADAPAVAKVQLWFHDVLGDSSASTTDPNGAITVPVGYTDPLLGPGAWPATTISYSVGVAAAPAAVVGTALLTARVALQAIAYQTGAAEAGVAAAARAAGDLARFARIYYQLGQTDVTAGLLATLQQAAGADPALLPVPLAVLRAFITGTYIMVSSLAQGGSLFATPGTTLGALATTYGVDFDAMGDANAGTALGLLLATTTLAVPQMATVAAGQSVQQICAAQPAPQPDPTTVLEDPDNTILPLQAGTELAVPPYAETVPATPQKITDLVAGWRCSVASFVAQNHGVAGLLTPGFVFTCNGYTVPIATDPPGSDATLDAVAASFATQGVTYSAAMIVQLNAGQVGMLRPGATVQIGGYVIAAGDTLAANAGAFTPAELAPLNVATLNVFPSGTPLFLQTLTQALSATAALGDIAAALGFPPGSLLRHNPGVAVAAQLALPGFTQVAAGARVPYTVQAGDSLAGIAAAFATTTTNPALELAQGNADVPGVIAAGTALTVGGQQATVQTGDTLAVICAQRFAPAIALAALVAAIGATPGVIAAGGVLACPLGALRGSGALTPAQAAAPYHVSPAALLSANASKPGVIAAGIALAASPEQPGEQETTAANDSLTAIVRRFQLRGVNTGVDAVVTANLAIAFVRGTATVLVPPCDAVVTATLGGLTGVPDAPWQFPAPIFPIHVWLQIARVFAMCNADLRGTPENPTAVARTRTAIPAARPGATDGGAVTLAGFATALEAAVPVVRVATGKVLSEQEDAAATDVWAVVFSANRITSVGVTPPLTLPNVPTPQPRSYALRPLVTTLVARQGVTIQTFDATTGTLTGGDTVDYQGVDLEVWARSFLADVDTLLAARYVPGAYAVNSAALEALLDAKQALAAAVAAGLDYVLVNEGSTGRASAVETVRQELLVSLARGYATSAVLQYDSAVTSPWTTEVARLSGAADVTFTSTDPQLAAASVGASKISLASGADQVNVLVSIPDVAKHETLPMQLAFRLVELEHNIATEIEGYDRSDWLAFVNPVTSGSPAALAVNLGAPIVPLPLRAYPPMPALLDQHADGPAAVTSLADAVHWTYRFALRHQSAAQDEILVQLELNQPPPARRFAVAPTDDLFAQLAQYTAVAAPLVGMLAGLADPSTVPAATPLAAALATYAQLAGYVAGAWARHWTPPPIVAAALPAAARLGAPVPETYAYTITLQADAASQQYQTLTLQRTAGDGGIGWPTIKCITIDGVRHELAVATACGCPPVPPGTPGPACQCYAFPAGIAAFSLLTFELAFGGLHIAAYQNAAATVWVTRNAALFGNDQPATAAAFVYRTPQVGYPEPVVPFIAIAEDVGIGAWSYAPATCPLVPAFSTIFDGDAANRTIACGVRYGYALAAGSPPLEAFLPVKQSPSIAFGAATVTDIAAALQAWATAVQPNVAGGRWAFWIDLYSTVDPSLQRPVLQLKRLVSPLGS